MAIEDLSKRLTQTITEAANDFSWLDRCLNAVADKLNAHKLRELEAEISKLETMQKDARAREIALQDHLQEMQDDISRLQEHRSFRGADLATLGLSYLVRQVLTDDEHQQYQQLQERSHRELERVAKQGRQIKAKADSLHQQLERMRQQTNPSSWARLIRWVLAIKNTLVGILNAIAGNMTQAISNWAAVLKAVPQLARS